jgi:hypothetical protein
VGHEDDANRIAKGRRMPVRGVSLVVAAGIAALAGQAFGKAEEDQSGARATRNALVVVAGNTPGPPGKFLPPPPPRTLQRAPEGTAQKLIDAQGSRAVQRELFRKLRGHTNHQRSPPKCRRVATK